MHLPDHYLSPEVCAASAAGAAAALAGGYWRLRGLARPSVLSLSTAGAGIFAAQMVNFPIDGGTSGHLIGGALAAILLGPWAAMVVMAVVLAVQCLLFADGGVMALGANVLNMAVIAPLVGWSVYRLACGTSPGLSRRMLSAAVAGWLSVVAAAVACSVELAASGTEALGATLAAMTPIHALIGLSEALITTAAVALAMRRQEVGRIVVPRWAGLAAAIGIVVLLTPLASSLPDGLEAVAAQLHFARGDSSAAPTAVMPDYALRGIDSPEFATIAAGLIGVVVCVVLTWAIGQATLPRHHADSRS
jgi:cobalt/nickel transport system permease protein